MWPTPPAPLPTCRRSQPLDSRPRRRPLKALEGRRRPPGPPSRHCDLVPSPLFQTKGHHVLPGPHWKKRGLQALRTQQRRPLPKARPPLAGRESVPPGHNVIRSRGDQLFPPRGSNGFLIGTVCLVSCAKSPLAIGDSLVHKGSRSQARGHHQVPLSGWSVSLRLYTECDR